MQKRGVQAIASYFGDSPLLTALSLIQKDAIQRIEVSLQNIDFYMDCVKKEREKILGLLQTIRGADVADLYDVIAKNKKRVYSMIEELASLQGEEVKEAQDFYNEKIREAHQKHEEKLGYKLVQMITPTCKHYDPDLYADIAEQVIIRATTLTLKRYGKNGRDKQ